MDFYKSSYQLSAFSGQQSSKKERGAGHGPPRMVRKAHPTTELQTVKTCATKYKFS